MKNYTYFTTKVLILIACAASLTFGTNLALADVSPAGCTGSGLGITLTVNNSQVSIGSVISYSVNVFNGLSSGGSSPIVCDASNIIASLVTPDGQNHPITLLRTALTNGQSDYYPNVVTYTARAQDANDGVLVATASDTGSIHQNDTDSQGGGNQELNVEVIVPPTTLHVIKVVVNNSGTTAVSSNFNLHVKSAGVDVSGSPAPGAAAPGTLYTLFPGAYTVSEDASSSYTESFSGACDSSGNVTVVVNTDKTCTVTNTSVAVTPAASVFPAAPVYASGGGGGGGIGCANCVTTIVATVTPPTVLPTFVAQIASATSVVATVTQPPVPSSPDTGRGGEAETNILILFLSAIVFLGAGIWAMRILYVERFSDEETGSSK